MGIAARYPVQSGAVPPTPLRSQEEDRSHCVHGSLPFTPHSLYEADRWWRSAKRADRSHCATGLLPFAPHFLRTAGSLPAVVVGARHGALPLARTVWAQRQGR